MFAAGVCMSEAQNPIPPPYTLYCIGVYGILLHTGKKGGGGRVEPEGRLEGKGSQSWVENTCNMTECLFSL
jgi:hypothetical protein